ncbi:chloride channel K [Clupea harengus]|uniref:Chloride channel K n=1 Tax=Clupea harengus TaxID=7950 RepID=A0A6P8FC82_CLUHA|nr:chloride channel K [Clupea harengus]
MKEVQCGPERLAEYMRMDEENSVTQAEEMLMVSNMQSRKPCRRSRSMVKECMQRIQAAVSSVVGLHWLCYVALGVLTALLSFCMNFTVAKLLRAHQWLYSHLEGHAVLQFLCWTLYPTSLCALSTSFSHSICPYSAGSGVPEVRCMLAGVELPDYLSLPHLFAKVVGLTCSLAAGSTIFLGKVGPFVHLSTMLGAYLYRLCASAASVKEGKPKQEILVVSAAVGVASCFGAPISGVLFSVEVMGTHYAVRDYYPSVLAAASGALAFHLLSVCGGKQETVQALFKTTYSTNLPFQPVEILAFAVLGLLCGAVSCLYLLCHRWILQFMRTNAILSKILATERVLYSGGVAFLLASITFPLAAGHFMAAKLSMNQLLSSLLEETQWYVVSQNASVQATGDTLWQAWSPSGSTVYVTLGVFLLMKLWMLVLACTLPLPAGYFMPVFIYGAAVGRLLGEGLAHASTNGVSSQGTACAINPGGYALAGAAAFSGAVTHTLSPALLALELTGQHTHAVPVLLATLLANALARSRHRPSFYDAIAIIKKLPHPPSLLRTCPKLLSVPLRQVVRVPTAVLESQDGVTSVQQLLRSSTERMFPVVDSHESGVLLGSVSRLQLEAFLHGHRHGRLDKKLVDQCSFQPVKIQLSTEATIKQAYSVLGAVREQCLFVTERGRLAGVITWSEINRIMEERHIPTLNC